MVQKLKLVAIKDATTMLEERMGFVLNMVPRSILVAMKDATTTLERMEFVLSMV